MEEIVFGRRYRAIEKIGSGGMAEVFKAVDEVLGRTVAVKVLHPRYASEPNFVARFRQEAQAAANLSHPSIVNIYDWGRDDETYYIVMEYVNGTDLKTLIEDHGALDPMKAAEYGMQACAALAVAHGYDIIHRDIKPHNIVIAPDGTVKVMDFGIARAGNTTMTQTGSVLGTAQYISPEQAQGRTLGPASDLYSLGVTLYELVTGRVPFDADTPVAVALKQVNEAPIPPRQVRPSVPVALDAVIMRAMSKNPSERYQSAAEMREDLKRVVNGEAMSAPPQAYNDQTSVMPAIERAERQRIAQAPQVRPIPQRRVQPWVWIVVALVVIALGLGVAFALGAFGTGSVAIPTVLGMTEQEATSLITSQGLTVGEVTTANSDEYELGLIISQDPAAGGRVDKGTAINLVISAGVEQVVVPTTADMTEADAITTLEAAGLTIALPLQREYSTDVAEGLVISTEPVADAEVPKGTKVTIVISKGTELAKVPDVVGKKQAEAEAAITAAGFKVKVKEDFNDTIALGVVIRQSPDSGVSVDAGSTITITVSKGPNSVIVPDVTDMMEVDARAELEGLGLKVDVVYVISPDVGIVLNQNPLPTTKVTKKTVITLQVGKAP
ncbi:MAG: serine/threonine protein kinase [Actinobacteria bacterium HGW-Actinobacteria-6]|nr:MAG: serine/threonine protein kinase [Actinobacteria bacterium HGW-Actinobacteria-6]